MRMHSFEHVDSAQHVVWGLTAQVLIKASGYVSQQRTQGRVARQFLQGQAGRQHGCTLLAVLFCKFVHSASMPRLWPQVAQLAFGQLPEFEEAPLGGHCLSRVCAPDGKNMQHLPGSWLDQARGLCTAATTEAVSGL
jgi:hypothetical protein